MIHSACVQSVHGDTCIEACSAGGDEGRCIAMLYTDARGFSEPVGCISEASETMMYDDSR